MSEKEEQNDEMPVNSVKPEGKYDEKHKSVQCGVFYSTEVTVHCFLLFKGGALFTLDYS